MRRPIDETLATALSVSTSRVALLAVDTRLGVQNLPECEKRCRTCRRRRCRC